MKPVAMLGDALIDLTNRGEVVLDPFLGSGSTLIAAENTGRICCGIELDPLYVDVIIRRFEAETGTPAILAETGETFEDLAARRRNDESGTRSRFARSLWSQPKIATENRAGAPCPVYPR